MKRLVLSLTLAALAAASLHAQDTHHGPVVYPTNMSPETGSAPATNLAPTPDTGALTLPPLDASPSTTSPANGSPVVQPPADSAAPAPAAPAADASAPAANDNTTMAPDAPVSTPGSASTGSPSMTPNSGLAPLQNPSSPSARTNGSKPDDIYDIRPPYFYLKPLTWLWVLLAVLALLASAFALWAWLRPNRTRRAKTAYELALEKLEKARAMLNEQNPEPYAVLVSETIRNYLGQRFQTPSTRRTTEEFLRQMQADTNTPLAEHRDLLRHFLEACDLVKFAHYQPGREELEQVQERAVSFVTATRPLEGVPA